MKKSKPNKKKIKERFPGFQLVTTEESEIVNFGTNVWFREDPFGVIIVFPAGQTLKILPKHEVEKEKRKRSL